MSTRTTASLCIVALICGVQLGTIARAQVGHSALHKTQFVTVEGDIRLEVLDWGGQGGDARVPGRAGKHCARIR